MKKIISFLGKNPYKETIYTIEGQQYKTSFVQDALTQHFSPDSCYIALTPGVQKDTRDGDGQTKTNNWTLLKEASAYNYTELDISESQTQEAHFEILEKIISVIQPDDELILDITHSFRSIPMVALAAAFYLKANKKIKSLKIFYGAFERGSNAPTPIHELTGLLEIMEWVNAAQVFQRFGDGSDFAELLKLQHHSVWKDQDTTLSDKPRTLQNYATKLIEASHALNANQPKDIMTTALAMNKLEKEAHDEVNSWAKPFALVFDDVHQQLSDFADLDLTTQKNLLHWYAGRGRLVETSQLAREWVVTYTARYLGIMSNSPDDIFDKDLRDETEIALGLCYQNDFTEKPVELSKVAAQLHVSECYKQIMGAWGDFIDTRNTLSHCGFNSTSQPVATLHSKINQWVKAIDALPDIIDPA